MSGLPLPEPVADEDDDGLQDRAALLTPARPRPGRRRPRPRPHTAAGRCLPLVKTLTICLAFFTLGLCMALPGPTLLDLQEQVSVSLAQISQIFFWRALGYLGGSMISGLLFDKLNRLLMMLASMALAAAGMATVPWLSSILSLNICFAALGVPLGFVDTGGNVLLLDLWGRSSGPYMQAIHFSFGLGAFAAPLLAVPFIAHTSAVNGTAAVLLGRNHLHAVALTPDVALEPVHVPDLPGHLTNLPDRRPTPMTRPPAAIVTHRSSVKRSGLELPHLPKLGVALAGGDAAVRLPRSVEGLNQESESGSELGSESKPKPETKPESESESKPKPKTKPKSKLKPKAKSRPKSEPEPEPATVQGLGRDALMATEDRKSSVGRKEALPGDGDGDGGPGIGEAESAVGTVETKSPVSVATELAMGGGTVRVTAPPPAAAEVSVSPSVAVMDNSGTVSAPSSGAAAARGAGVTSKPTEDASATTKLSPNDTRSPETRVNLPGELAASGDASQAGQNASEETMHDAVQVNSISSTDSPPDVTTVADSAVNVARPTGEPALQHTPKPKPAFTDGNKLEHDQTWARPPLKPGLHPAPAAGAKPDTAAAAGGSSARLPDTAEEPATEQTDSSVQTDDTPASSDDDEAGRTTPTPGTESEVPSGDGGGEAAAVEAVQSQNGTAVGPEEGPAEVTEGGRGSGGEVSSTATVSAIPGDAAGPVPVGESASSSDGTHTVAAGVTDGSAKSKPTMDVAPSDGDRDVVLATQSTNTPEPASKSANGVVPSNSESPSAPPVTIASALTEAVADSVSSPSPSVSGSPSTSGSGSSEAAGADGVNSGQTTEPVATETPASQPEPVSAEVRPAPEEASSEAEDSDWDTEDTVVGTEPGLSVPAVPPTAAAPATLPGILAATASPTTGQGTAETGRVPFGGSGRLDSEHGGRSPLVSSGAAGDSEDHPQPTVTPKSSPVTVIPAAPSASPPSASPPKPHKPGTYDDTSAEDGLLTRLSSAAAVRGVPPLAQLYLLVSCLLLLVALIFLALLVYDPRARRAAPSSDTGSGPSRCYTATLVALMAVVLCFYVGMEVGMGQLLMSFSVHSKVHLSRAGGAYVTSVFWGLFATGRALSVCVAGVLRPAAVLAVDYALVTAGSAVLLVAGNWDRTALLMGGALTGLGMASVFPGALVWLEQHVHVNSRLAAVLVVAGALGEMLLPAGVGALMASDPQALIYSLAVCVGVCLLAQAAAVVAARVGRPAVGPLEGYQLAAQEEEEDMVDLSKYPGSAEEGSRRLLRM